tara:strand:- start:299 stop:598 length:300 start_codon:yes stop_codon:yes gene_type:complete
METTNAKEFIVNPELTKDVDPDTHLKNMIVEYVGEEINPEDKNVTLEMVIAVMANQFPELVLALAEENWIRGYQQALDDVEVGKKIAEQNEESNKLREE